MTATNAHEFMVWKMAKDLSPTMQMRMLDGYYNEGSSTVILNNWSRTLKALQRRGLVHADRRWTKLGREVARILRGGIGERGEVKTLDQLHEMALDEDRKRFPTPGPCELQASPFCEGMAVMVRLDPMAMAPEDPAPVSTVPTCQECFDHRSDQYLRSVAR